MTASRRAAAILESIVDSAAYAVRALASVQPGVLTCELGGQLSCCDVEGVLVHHRLEAVVGCHRGQHGVVGRGYGAVHGSRGAVVRQLQVHAVGSALLERPVGCRVHGQVWHLRVGRQGKG